MNQTKIVRVTVRITESVIDIIKDEFMNDKPKKKKSERTKGKDEDKGRKDKKRTGVGGRNSSGSNTGNNL